MDIKENTIMPSLQRIHISLLMGFTVIIAGTSGYVLLEGYSVGDALYMTVITITTVGYGEIRPLSEVGRGFTIILIFAGFGAIAFAAQTVIEDLMEKVLTNTSRERSMKKLISKLNSHHIICGYGRVGSAAAERFHKAGSPFVLIEKNPEMCKAAQEKGYLVIAGDSTSDETLVTAGIKKAQGLLASLPSDPDNLFIVLTAREFNPTLHIIARSDDPSSEKKLLRGGADKVISPFVAAGKEIADNLLETSGSDGALDDAAEPLTKALQWIDVSAGSTMIGESVGKVSKDMRCEVIGLRSNGKDVLSPEAEARLKSGDSILVIKGFAGIANSEECTGAEHKKVVIVDDNPVTLRLYSRLLQRAGFIPITAVNGLEAVDVIIREKPEAAVIDFMLPVLSGIEVCKEVRGVDTCSDVKLILFTGDDQPETQRRAMEAGADYFVLKTPESSELIETVIKAISEGTSVCGIAS